MDLSKLESDAKAFESSSDFWSSWLAIATGLVVLGLILEYRKDIVEIVRRRPFERKKLEHLIGAALVTIGVAGELTFQPFMGSAENSLRGVTHHIEALLSKEAGDANERAGEANERAAKIEAAAAPRDIHLPKTFIPAFAAIQRRRVIKVNSYASDAEGGRLADEIIHHLHKMNFVVQDDSLTRQALRPMAFGVQVTGSDADLVAVLMSWMDESDLLRPPPENTGSSISIGYDQTTGGEQPAATIFVGSKPLPKGS